MMITASSVVAMASFLGYDEMIGSNNIKHVYVTQKENLFVMYLKKLELG